MARPAKPGRGGGLGGMRLALLIIGSNFVMLMLFYTMTAPTRAPAPSNGGGNKPPLRGAMGLEQQPRMPPAQCPPCNPMAPEPCDCSEACLPLQRQLYDLQQQQQQQQPQQQQQQAVAPQPCPPQQPCPACATPEPCPACNCPSVEAAVAEATASAVAAKKPRFALLGLASGIEFELAYRFVRSFREASPTADLVIFTDKVPSDLQQLFTAFAVTVVKYSNADLGKYAKYHPSSYRWILMDKWLRALPADQRYNAVMFCDTRDTVFQSDPFAMVTQDAFYATLENKPKTIRQCGWNRKWVSDCFGTKVLRAVGNKIISCSGTSIATWGPALE